MKYLLLIPLVALAALIGWFAPKATVTPTVQPILGATNLIAGNTYTLSGGGVSSSATSITLSSLTIKQTTQKIQDSDLSDTFYITIEPGNNTRQEIVSCTTVTQNAAGTATLSGCSRGISPVRPYIASSTLQFAHAGGTQVIFSDAPSVFDEMANVQNTTVISGQWQFTTLPTSSVAVTQAFQFVNKAYADALSIQGSPTSTFAGMGQVRLATRTQLAAGTASSSNLFFQPLVIPAIFASSTPVTGLANNIVPITDTSGFISPLFMATTTAYPGWTFSNASSTNFGVLSTLNLGGLGFTFSSSRGASSSVPTENGSGSISWNLPDVRTLLVDGTSYTTQSTATTTLKLLTIPAGTLGANDQVIISGQFGYTTNQVNADADVAIGFGNGVSTTTFINDGRQTVITPFQAATFQITIRARNSLTTQIGYATLVGQGQSGLSTLVASSSISNVNTANQSYISFSGRVLSASDTAGFTGISVEVRRGK